MKLKKPVIIIGTGRSGTTILHKVLSEHRKLAWLSPITNQLPNMLFFHRLYMSMVDLPIIGKRLKNIFKPNESYKFWDTNIKGFSEPFRNLRKDDLTNYSYNNVKRVFPKLLTKKKNRLLVKITGWPRINFIDKLFEDALFINIIRDGRSVANSLIKEKWWLGWKGPSNWRWGELTKENEEKWKQYGKSFLALAAIEWLILMEKFEEEKKAIASERFFEIKYEDLCENPINTFESILNFCHLEYDKEFMKKINRYNFKNTNYKWEKDLTKNQKEILNSILKDKLEIYDYL